MARQKGLHKIIGTIGDATYSKTKDGYRVKEKSEISKAKFNTADSMVRTRENASEFGRAGQSGKLFRMAIRSVLKYAKDSRVTSRLTGQLLKVIKEDATSVRGMRNVMDGETELLKGFEFNINATLSMSFPVEIVPSINRVTGEATVAIPAFIPTEDVIAPDRASHVKLICAATAIDFEAKKYVTTQSNSLYIPIKGPIVPASTLTNTLPAASTHPLFIVFGLQFFQEVNGAFYSLKNGEFNTLTLVEVNGL